MMVLLNEIVDDCSLVLLTMWGIFGEVSRQLTYCDPPLVMTTAFAIADCGLKWVSGVNVIGVRYGDAATPNIVQDTHHHGQ